MNILGIVQEFCKRTGLTVPTLAVGSPDDTIVQLVGLANEIVEDILDRGSWTSFQRQALVTSVAAESQGVMTTLADVGFKSVIDNTLFDRTTRLPLIGPLSPQDWQALKALPTGGPRSMYRIVQGEFLIYPTIEAGHELAFEYTSNAAVYNADDATFKNLFTKDADVFVLDYQLVLKGLRWRWKEEKGFPYAESFRQYEKAITMLKSKDGTKPTLDMDGSPRSAVPAILVPDSSWVIPNV